MKQDIPNKKCVVCGIMFISDKKSKLQCSKQCTKKKWKISHRDKVNDWQRKWFYKKAREDWKNKICADCGKEFLPNLGNKNQQIYCSIKCRFRKNHKNTKQKEKYILKNPNIDIKRYWKIINRKKVQDANYKAKVRGCKKYCEKKHIHLKDWLEIKQKFENKCVMCGKEESIDFKLSIDHIIPISKGGLNIKENIQPLCLKCNSKKGNRWW